MAFNHTFHHYFDLHIGTVFARQLRLSRKLGKHVGPLLDIPNGTVTFWPKSVFNIQLLGTQLEKEQTWLWAWSDHNTPPYPQNILSDAQEIKALGHMHNIEQFAYDQVPLELSSVPLVPDEMNGDYIATIAAGLFNTAYWRYTHKSSKNGDTAILFFLIKNPSADILTPCTAPEILNTIEEIAAYYETDDQVMVQSFLEQQGFTTHWDKNHLKAQRSTETIDATFGIDDHCIEEIEAHGFEGEEQYQDSDDVDDNWFDEEEEEFPPPLLRRGKNF